VEVRLDEVRPPEVRLDEVRPAEVRPPAEVRLDEVRLEEGLIGAKTGMASLPSTRCAPMCTISAPAGFTSTTSVAAAAVSCASNAAIACE
jgi:hypothetical protein